MMHINNMMDNEIAEIISSGLLNSSEKVINARDRLRSVRIVSLQYISIIERFLRHSATLSLKREFAGFHV